MSDDNQHHRRVAARVVRVLRVAPRPVVAPPRPGAAVPAPVTAATPARPTRPGERPRAYGTPLAAATRFQRPSASAGRKPFARAMAAYAASAAPLGGGAKAVTQEALESELEDDVAPLIIWEQPPQPRQDPRPSVPRWVENVALVPDANELSELGAYLSFMMTGFAQFCRSPAVRENGTWHARLAMPAAVIPETTLDVNISPFVARLRFETTHAISQNILERHVAGLQAQVKAALDDTREVEVSLW